MQSSYHMDDLGEFTDTFLQGVAAALRRRRKAIAFRGDLVFAAEREPEERLDVDYASGVHNLVVSVGLQAKSRCRIRVLVARGAQRGKKIWDSGRLSVIPNPKSVAESIEKMFFAFDESADIVAATSQQAERWKKLAFRTVK